MPMLPGWSISPGGGEIDEMTIARGARVRGSHRGEADRATDAIAAIPHATRSRESGGAGAADAGAPASGAAPASAIPSSWSLTSCALWILSSGILLEALPHEAIESGRGCGDRRADRPRHLLEDGGDERRLRLPVEGAPSGRHLVDQRAEGEEDRSARRPRSPRAARGPCTEKVPTNRPVGRQRARERRGGGEVRRRRGEAHRFREAEVEELRPAFVIMTLPA